jgi:hypothetical protein
MAHESGPGGTARFFCVYMVFVDVRRDPRVVDLGGGFLHGRFATRSIVPALASRCWGDLPRHTV